MAPLPGRLPSAAGRRLRRLTAALNGLVNARPRSGPAITFFRPPQVVGLPNWVGPVIRQ